MKKFIVLVLFGLLSYSGYAQLGVINNQKPLAFLNPAMQNYDTDKRGVVSASYVMSPFLKQSTPGGFLAIGEFKVTDKFRVGLHGSSVENRLNASSSYKAYLSYKLEIEKGSYLILGADAGVFTDELKPKEFNEVLAPNKFTFEDTISSGLDLGVGIAYEYNGLTVGLGFSKLNRPNVYNFPVPVYERVVDSTRVISGNDTTWNVRDLYNLKDTTIHAKEGDNRYGLQTNLNVFYQWDVTEKVNLMHSFHIANIDLTGPDFLSFQTIVNLNKRHSFGGGVFYNGYTGFMASAGYGISENLKLEASSFFIQDLNYNSTTSLYENDGFKPTLEFNIRYHF